MQRSPAVRDRLRIVATRTTLELHRGCAQLIAIYVLAGLMCLSAAFSWAAIRAYGRRGYWALFSIPAAILLWGGGIMVVLVWACSLGDCP